MALIFLFLFFNSAMAASPLDVAINEIAWMGSKISSSNEWIELRNNANIPISLDGWVLKATDGSPVIKLTGKISADSFYLLERSKNYTGALENNGEVLELYDNSGNLIDRVDASSGWPAGNNKTKQTMERINSGWQTSRDAGGTPKTQNPEKPKVQQEFLAVPVAGKQLAAVAAEPMQTQKSLYIFLIAAILAALSGLAILLLKKKII